MNKNCLEYVLSLMLGQGGGSKASESEVRKDPDKV
jgi:hypothetical protein